MIALTQEKREEFIRQLSDAIEDLLSLKNDTDAQWAINIYKIALASLTAEPFGYVDEDAVKDRDRLFSAQVFADEEDLPSYEFSELSYPLYLAPPVPEIKLPSINRYEKYLGTLAEDAWRDCIDEIKRLNGLGD